MSNLRHYYRDYIQHESHSSVEQLNATSSAVVREYSDVLTKSALTVFKTITRYSCVIIGVSWLKNATLAKLLGLSEKTIQRAYSQLKALGIIDVVPTNRKGLRSKNIVVIRLYAGDEKPAMSGEMSERVEADEAMQGAVKKELKQEETSKTYNNLDSDKEFISGNNISHEFVEAIQPIYGNELTYRLWRRYLIAKNGLRLQTPELDLIGDIIATAKRCIFRAKRGNVKDICGYYYTAIYNTLSIRKRQETASTGNSPVNNFWNGVLL